MLFEANFFVIRAITPARRFMHCVQLRKFRFSADESHRLRILYDKYIYDKLVCIIYNGDKITTPAETVFSIKSTNICMKSFKTLR